MKKKALEVMKASCSTCPFTDKGWVELREHLQDKALALATPICHSTGHMPSSRAKRVSKKKKACRGARNFQLQIFFAMGFLSAPTDEAWERKFMEIEADEKRNTGI